ncbi:hypothetical protein QFC21_004533 [Naganishia friedmannii]|uniref:Uncharacterized protein n=1 Tax=Naganishia friedmannii TaxID=89922 RepID=A0ACC2VGT6_9TREE|nr:hypothetical protein QFC21_004533 [Naganishia friedmannii]
MALPQVLPLHHLRHLHPAACNLPSISQWWNNLRKESEVLEHVRFIGERFTTLKYARIYDQIQVDGFVSEFHAFARLMAESRLQIMGDIPLYLNCCAAQIGLYFRFTQNFAFRLPFVLGPECRQRNMLSSGGNLMQASHAIAKCIDADSTDYRSLPAFHVSMAMLACGTLLQLRQDPKTEAPESLSKGQLLQVCQKLSHVHPMVAMVVSGLERPMGITADIRDFVHSPPTLQQSTPSQEELAGLFDFTDPSFAPENLEMFTEWIWPEGDWLSGLLLAGANDSSGNLGI